MKMINTVKNSDRTSTDTAADLYIEKTEDRTKRDTKVSSKLSDNTARIEALESIINSRIENLKDFYTVGSALVEIRNQQLYKPIFTNFYKYCRDRFKLTEPRIKQLIRGVKVRDSLPKEITQGVDLTERHCRELHKIKDLGMRSQVVDSLVERGGNITAKAIQQEYRNMRIEAVNHRDKPVLPPVNSVIKLTTKYNHELKRLDNYWGYITDVNEFTCEASVLGQDKVLVSPQDFFVVEKENQFLIGFAIGHLSRLSKIYNHPGINYLAKTIIETLAKDAPYIPDDMTNRIIEAIEEEVTSPGTYPSG